MTYVVEPQCYLENVVRKVQSISYGFLPKPIHTPRRLEGYLFWHVHCWLLNQVQKSFISTDGPLAHHLSWHFQLTQNLHDYHASWCIHTSTLMDQQKLSHNHYSSEQQKERHTNKHSANGPYSLLKISGGWGEVGGWKSNQNVLTVNSP